MVEKKTECKVFLSVIVCVIIIGFVFNISNASACVNGPNYDGMLYSYVNPTYPQDYIIYRTIETGENGDYGTHDWFADGVICTLKSQQHNPNGYNKWDWLLSNTLSTQRYPNWESAYSDASKNHYVVRSYFTYLYATQMPDVERTGEGGIYIWEEGVNIKDVPKAEAGSDSGKWVGIDPTRPRTQHRYNFEPVKITDSVYGFTPVPPYVLPSKAHLLGDQAKKCIANTEKDNQGNDISAMKPEGASAWLGAMTHYYCDLVVPAHLLDINKYEHVYIRDYHNWFEYQLGQLTLWDQYGNGGPSTDDMLYDKDVDTITSMRPDNAATALAVQAINIAYRTDGNHQYIENEPKSGLFINASERIGLAGKDYMKNWDWDFDIGEYGEDSVHKVFYDKVEKLLGYANYYCACAMQWVYDEAERELKDKNINDPDPNHYAKNPLPPPKDKIVSKPKNKDEISKSSQTNINQFTEDTVKNAAKMAPKLLAGGGVGIIGWRIAKNLKKSNKTVLKGFKKNVKR